MTAAEFIINLQDTDNWDEKSYQEWLHANPSLESDMVKRSQYLVSLGAIVPTPETLDDFVEEHSGPESPTEPLMELILYQMYFKWLVWVKGCDYS